MAIIVTHARVRMRVCMFVSGCPLGSCQFLHGETDSYNKEIVTNMMLKKMLKCFI